MIRLLLTGATVIDGTGRPPQPADILVEGERIEGVGPPEQFRHLPESIRRVDVAGRTLIPGMADLHCHLMMDGEADYLAGSADRRPPAEETIGYLMAKMVRNAERTLAAGFTFVRETGCKYFLSVDLKRAVDDGVLRGPRIVPAQPLIMTGGHFHRLGAIEADGPDELRKAARLAIKNGIEVIKVMATGGVGTPGTEPGSPQLTVEEIRATVEVALWAGKRTMTHAQGALGIRNAVEAGVQCIDHGQFMGTDDDLMKLMRERNVAYVPTLCNNPLKIEAEEQAQVRGAAFGIAGSLMRKARMLVGPHRVTFEKAMELGLRIGCGTDVGSPYNFHGENAQELEMMVRYGMSPTEAIKCATLRSAEIVGLQKDLGSIEPGKLADIVVVGGDPIANVNILRRPGAIEAVFLGGQLVAGGTAEGAAPRRTLARAAVLGVRRA
jgi:imidazolonepropionase-like amidohydrolase